jgi:hypothetical protein
LRGLLSDAEVDVLRAEVEGGLRDAFGSAFGANTRDDMPSGEDDEVAAEGNFLPLMADRTPLSQSLVADDPRLASFAEKVLGACTLASPALATLLVADTPWHNDPGIGERWVRFNAYLQPATESTGALRVVPGSQDRSLPDDVGVALETMPGDVIAFDPRVRHGAWGGGPRLRWNVDFVALPDESDAQRFAHTRGLIEELSSWPSTDRWPTWSEWAAGTNEARQAAVQKLSALGVLSRQ